ncbi:hypothetical protein ERJ75_000188000 [Trypanosoma vivax]|nr:hypothetical protein ERJ75_000188000 [Trypanosoma vivax]
MAGLVQQVRRAEEFICRAREEETPTGNPLTAARNYITAMEIIAHVSAQVSLDNTNNRRFFLHQLRHRMEVYYERVELLLQVAEEMNLIDDPTTL